MNLPNILTVLRMVMIPIVIAFFAADLPYWALAFFLLAEFTDFLDGHIARRYNLVTKFGKVMDPLADKLMLMTTLFCLYATDRIPLWVPIVICIKECSMIVIGALLYRKDILSELGLSLPETWEDLYDKIIPVLYQNNMQFYIPAANQAEVESSFGMFLCQLGGGLHRGLREDLTCGKTGKL